MLGDWALESAVRQIRSWQDGPRAGIPVSVNLSPRQVQASLVDRVAHLLNAAGVDPGLLDLEITESAVLENNTAVIETLSRLRSLGVSISLDDFGTGYSSLSYLRRLPLDAVKLDRSFVERIDVDPQECTLLSAILSMMQALDLRVIIEGVERVEQTDVLEELGVDQVQGYQLCPALPPDDLPLTCKDPWKPDRSDGSRGGSRSRRRRKRS